MILQLEKHMNKGCVLIFDQFNSDIWPGETKAIKIFFKKIKKNIKSNRVNLKNNVHTYIQLKYFNF